MKRGVGCGLVAVLAAAAVSACQDDYGPLDLHPDVVWLEVLLVEGESEARMVARHPHREGEPPELSAHLEGPGWEAAFSDTLELGACTVDRVPSARCLRASLPEPVRAGTSYGLRGTAPLGSFIGEARVPDSPVQLADTLLLSWPDKAERLPIPLRYRVGPDIGVLLVDVWDILETLEDGTEVELPAGDLGLSRWAVDHTATADTVWIDVREKPLRFSAGLLGIGRQWTNFVFIGSPVIRPWPAFGIEGDGVYGYFDGVARSRPLRILVTPGPASLP